jgi:uncharacterized protein (TIGR03437 family)
MDSYMLKPVVQLASLALLAAAPIAFAQQYSISTIAGGAPFPTPASATATAIGKPNRVTLDSSGNLYFTSGNCVYKMSGTTLTLVAGNSRPGFSGDGGAAVNAQLNGPAGLAVDKSGNLYVADANNNRVRIVTPNGIINTFAGTGQVGGPANLNDGGPANQAYLHLPGGVAVDSSGNVYIADTGDNAIREVTTNGIINSIAGDGLPGYSGDTFLAVNAEVHSPEDVALDSASPPNVYIADTANAYIREITTSTGIINFIAGDGSVGYSGDGAAANVAGLDEPTAIALDSSGNVYFTEPEDGRVREITISNGYINTVVGNGVFGFSGDGGPATSSMLHLPTGLAIDSSANLYIGDTLNYRIRKLTGKTISTIVGNGVLSYSGDGGPATSAQMNSPEAVAMDSSGNVYIADTVNNVVREISTKGIISTIAGNGTSGFSGDNGAATSAMLSSPQGVVVDSSGNVYVSDTANARVRKISGGTITTVAGSGTQGYGGDGGVATSAQLYAPVGLAIDKSGNLYIADVDDSVVRRVSLLSGTIGTVAGNGSQGYSGDTGPAASAMLNGPQGVAVDASGNLYISDTLNDVIRVVNTSGTISTFAGNGIVGYSGDGGPAIGAEFGSPTGIALDSAGNLYLSDSGARIRKIFASGIIETIAGAGVRGYTGDGGVATSATLNGAAGLAVDPKGDVFIADAVNNAIRELVSTGAGLSISAVTNAASNQAGAIAPGEVLVIYGSNIGAASLTTYQLANGAVTTSLAGASVYINGVQAPVIYTSPNQVSAIAPFSLTGSTAQVFIVNQGQSTAPVAVNIVPSATAVFTLNGSGIGQAAAINQNNSVNSSSNPASSNQIVTLFITGAGQTNPVGQNGVPAAVPLPIPLLPVSAAIGGKNATIDYVGGSPGTVDGIIQVNVTVPAGLPAGNASVIVQVGNSASQGNVTIAVSGN